MDESSTLQNYHTEELLLVKAFRQAWIVAERRPAVIFLYNPHIALLLFHKEYPADILRALRRATYANKMSLGGINVTE